MKNLIAVVIAALTFTLCTAVIEAAEKSLIADLTQKQYGVRLVKDIAAEPVKHDWLITPSNRPVELQVKPARDMKTLDMMLTNGLVSRSFYVSENLACTSFKNLPNDAQFLRSVKPEARVMVDSQWYDIGGLVGQPEKSYLLAQWLPKMKSAPNAFRLAGMTTSKPQPRYPWIPKYNALDTPWPPKGLRVVMHYQAPESIAEQHKGLSVDIYYEMYENLPVVVKWFTLNNSTGHDIVVDKIESEVLAVNQDQRHRIHVESDYSFALVNAHPDGSALLHYSGEVKPYHAGKSTTQWRVDSEYNTWATHNQAEDNWLGFRHRCLLVSTLPMGPMEHIPSGGIFKSFLTFELLHDSDDEERQTLGHRRMYRKLAPQTTESLLTAAITSHDDKKLKQFIDQMSQLGFEKLDIHPWPGIDHTNLDSKYVSKWKAIADYAARKDIIMGGYELWIASRGRQAEFNCIDPKTGKPGSLFGQSVCIASRWKDDSFSKMWKFFTQTGFKSTNFDGPYHGDVCASSKHKYHSGLQDSQWRQWKIQVEALHEFQRRGCYIPIPDWYFLNGQCATAMGYREASANLTPQQQLLLGRQYIYDGTWHKIPTMGWMTLQLVGFYTNDPKVGLEPLAENIDRYESGLVQHLGSGCQFTVRGNRLYDSPKIKAMVKKWTDWYKQNRDILNSDIIHMGRPTGRDIDCILHVNSQLKTKGLAVIFNPTKQAIQKDLKLPLYYTGLTETASIAQQQRSPQKYKLDREYCVDFPISIQPESFTWIVIE